MIDNMVIPSLWIELLIDGMTFDVKGFALEVGAGLPNFIYKFDCETFGEGEIMEGVMISPGPHLARAENKMPVLRAMVRIAATLADRLDQLIGVGWAPSRSVMCPAYFSKVAGSWLEGGVFPALGLAAFARTETGEFVSEGLRFFTGQEVSFDAALSADPKRATRLGVRLLNELVGAAPVSERVEFLGSEGELLLLIPSEDGRVVRVTAE